MKRTEIAFDIALIPDKLIIDLATKYNHNLSKVKDGTYPMFAPENNFGKGCLPHITLAQGFVIEKEIERLGECLETIVLKNSPLNLKITHAYSRALPNSLIGVGLAVQNNQELQVLHEKIMLSISPFTSYEGSISTLYRPEGEQLDETSLYWIKNFRDQSFERFEPHITLGIGEPVNLNKQIDFYVNKIIIAHLGNYCTCRKILYSINLKFKEDK